MAIVEYFVGSHGPYFVDDTSDQYISGRQVITRDDLSDVESDSLTAKSAILGASPDYTEFESDGTMIARGNASCWDDITGSLVASQLNTVAGKLDYNWAENTITMEPGGNPANASDRLIFNFQVPHAAKLTTMNLHIHWEQTNTTVRTFRTDYRIQNNGSAKTTSWTTVTRDTGGTYDGFTYVSGTLNQITKLVEVDLTSAGLSSTIQFRLTRTDSNAGDVEATFVDAHVERDMLGSREEFTK